MKLHAACITAVVSLSTLALPPAGRAQILFEDNFDSGLSGANWVASLSNNDANTDTEVSFAFDYASLGIPSAPHSVGGTTVGMRFLVNQVDGVFQGISASPFNQGFSDNFVMHFDAWLNVLGPFPGGGSGSTQMATFGWGAPLSGSGVQWAGATNAFLLAADGDGGTTLDYRLYRAAGGAPATPDTGVYAAGTTTSPEVRNNTHPYYLPLGSNSAPAAQLALYPNQTGSTQTGSFGMAWRDVTVERSGNILSWEVDGLLIASTSIDDFARGGDNIVFGMFDPVPASSTDPNPFLNAAIFDNIRVESTPEPTSLVLLGVGACSIVLRRRRKERPGALL